jgi:hypothetical protein
MIGQKLYKLVISLNIAVNAFYLGFCISSGEICFSNYFKYIIFVKNRLYLL